MHVIIFFVAVNIIFSTLLSIVHLTAATCVARLHNHPRYDIIRL